jgi:hypothetical protein
LLSLLALKGTFIWEMFCAPWWSYTGSKRFFLLLIFLSPPMVTLRQCSLTRVQRLSLQSIICRSWNFSSRGVGTDAGCTPSHKIHFNSSLTWSCEVSSLYAYHLQCSRVAINICKPASLTCFASPPFCMMNTDLTPLPYPLQF